MIKSIIKNLRPFSWIYLIYLTEKKIASQKINNKRKSESNDLLQAKRVLPWFRDRGDETLRLNYDLNESSLIFDVGGYKGEFARDIFCKYHSHIFLFEPLYEFYKISSDRFIKNKKVQHFNFGLSDHTGNKLISLSNDASSTVAVGEKNIEIKLVSILDFIKENDIKSVDLMKINIEGGEYSLLESILQNGDIRLFKNIQVQFHDFVIDNAKGRMQLIQIELAKTHRLTYQYEFVWENWERK